MKHFSKEELVRLSKPKVKEIEAGGYTFTIKNLSAYEAMQFREKASVAKTSLEQFELSCALISQSVIDENGETIFTEDEVKELDLAIFTELQNSILKNMGVTDSQIEEAKDKLEKDPFESSVLD